MFLMGISEVTHPFVSACVGFGFLSMPLIAVHQSDLRRQPQS